MSQYGDHNLLNSLITIRTWCLKLDEKDAEINAISKTLKPEKDYSFLDDKKRTMNTVFTIALLFGTIIQNLEYPIYSYFVWFITGSILYLIHEKKTNLKSKFLDIMDKPIGPYEQLFRLSVPLFAFFLREFIFIVLLALIPSFILVLIYNYSIGIAQVMNYNKRLNKKQLKRVNQIADIELQKSELMKDLSLVTGSWYPNNWDIYIKTDVLDFFIDCVDNKKAYTIQDLVQLLDVENHRKECLGVARKNVSQKVEYDKNMERKLKREMKREIFNIKEKNRIQNAEIKKQNDELQRKIDIANSQRSVISNKLNDLK